MELLLATTATVALVHTLIGPDHYLPFIVLSRAEGWPMRKTMLWTFICGLGHVLSSILIGLLGATLGWALGSMETFEGARGQIAAYALIGFGLLYFSWGLWRGRRGHAHVHLHADGSLHSHPHRHEGEAVIPGHEQVAHEEAPHLARHRHTAWTLFIIFVLGPCEPLIPLLLAPAASQSASGILAVALVFSVITISMMMLTVAIGVMGVRMLRFPTLERYAHAMAGFAIFTSGLLLQFLGL